MTAAAHAAPQRAFVASYGNDADPCSRAKPCRTFQTALAIVAAGGEVVAIDSGGYGPVSIDRSVSIVAVPGAVAWISATNQIGVSVFGFNYYDVRLRGLRIAVTGVLGLPAISLDSTTRIVIDDCTLSSESGAALASGGTATVRHSWLVDSALGAGLGPSALFEGVHIHSNTQGGAQLSNGNTIFRNVTISGNTGDGVAVGGYGGLVQARVNFGVSGSVVSDNAGHGIRLYADDGGGEGLAAIDADIAQNTIAANAVTGVQSVEIGGIAFVDATLAGNLLVGNGAQGAWLTRGIVTANTIAGNTAEGIHVTTFTVTRGNNAILQSTPVSGTLTPIPPY